MVGLQKYTNIVITTFSPFGEPLQDAFFSQDVSDQKFGFVNATMKMWTAFGRKYDSLSLIECIVVIVKSSMDDAWFGYRLSIIVCVLQYEATNALCKPKSETAPSGGTMVLFPPYFLTSGDIWTSITRDIYVEHVFYHLNYRDFCVERWILIYLILRCSDNEMYYIKAILYSMGSFYRVRKIKKGGGGERLLIFQTGHGMFYSKKLYFYNLWKQ